MKEAIEILKEFGPFTTPISILLILALNWCRVQIEKMEARAVAAEKDATALRDLRTKELVESTKALGDAHAAVGQTLRNHDVRIDAVLEELRKRFPNYPRKGV